MKAANTPPLGLSEGKEGASHTPVPNLKKVSKEDGVLFFPVEEQSKSLKGKIKTKPKGLKNR